MNAIVTGAGKGIGRAIAMKLASMGYNLWVGSRTESELQTLATEIKQQFPAREVYYSVFDASLKESCIAFVNDCLQTLDRVDILVNNAGSYIPGDLALEEDNRLEQLLQVNLLSAYHITRALLPAMKKQQQGLIVNMSSVAGMKPYEHGGSYSISKFALTGFSKNLREELKTFGIKVTTIYPGATFTNSWQGSGIEPSRIMQAEDIALVVGMLVQLSPQAVVEEIVLRPLLGDI
jgi:NADP-dependent 3-hydroxy acid dehydrogenase YdfG